MELNPNHPTTQAVSDHWHKIAALLLRKLGSTHVVITPDDIRSYPTNTCITVQEKSDGLHLRIVDEKEAYRLAREHGGLPT